ncbi:MAG: hypothetical protein WA418_41555 [Bradyrhizobium sp.]
MSDPEGRVSAPKLPFSDAASLAYSSYFRNLPQVLRACWLWLILVMAATALASSLQCSRLSTMLASHESGRLPGAPAASPAVLILLPQLLLALGGVSIAVAWHRFLILGEQPPFSGSNVVTRALWRYVLVGLVLFAIMVVPGWVAVAVALQFSGSFASPPPGVFLPLASLGLLLYVAGIGVALRLAVLLPARAVGDDALTFAQAWRQTRGSTLWLFWGFVVTALLPVLIADMVFVIVSPPMPRLDSPGDNVVIGMTTMTTVFSVLYLLILPIGIGFLSQAYRHFFRGADLNSE